MGGYYIIINLGWFHECKVSLMFDNLKININDHKKYHKENITKKMNSFQKIAEAFKQNNHPFMLQKIIN